MASFQVSIVVPLYNEQESFPILIQRLYDLFATQQNKSIEVVLVDDGSKDATPQLIQALALSDTRFQGVFLSRNHGHQTALTAGLAHAQGTEAVLTMDGDLQDSPEMFPQFYALLQEGYDVIYAIRQNRKETWTKRLAYYLFYRILRQISYIEIPLDSGDFALMSRRIVDILNQMPEESRYLRGMRSWVGFRQIGIPCERAERQAGDSKYSFRQLFNLAYDGIFNFSELPVKFVTRLGFVTVLVSLVFLLGVLIKKFFFKEVIEGYPSLLLAIILFSGIQLLSLGVIGEYVLRIFFQTKNRPLFITKHHIKNGQYIHENKP